jgi:hypothetical protein
MEVNDLLTYLDCVNAMVGSWRNVQDKFTNHKERAVAKKIVSMYSPKDIIRVVPYFVENYHEWAKEGFSDTNIYMLSFQFSTAKNRLDKKQGVRTKKRYDEDRL